MSELKLVEVASASVMVNCVIFYMVGMYEDITVGYNDHRFQSTDLETAELRILELTHPITGVTHYYESRHT